MKKLFAFVLALAMLFACAAFAEEEGHAPMPDGARAYEGNWACGRASMEMYREEEGFRVLISWGSSAAEHSEWEYSCFYDAVDNALVSMPFGTRTDITFGEDGEIAAANVIYEDGEAAFTLDEDGHLIWQDAKENAGQDMHFERMEIVDVENASDYSAVTIMSAEAVEAFAAAARQAYLDEDWATIAGMIDYPITMFLDNTQIGNSDEFLAYMQDKTVSAEDRAEMEAETCMNMFLNGQGICLGSGEIWLNDLNYMTDAEPNLRIITVNGIVKKAE